MHAKEPNILPEENHLTFLEIQRYYYKKVHNCGVKSGLKELCSKFWVLKRRHPVKDILSHCVTCKNMESTAFSQQATASLLEFKVNLAAPFSRVEVDFDRQCTVPLKCKLTASQSSIHETQFSILDSWKLWESRLESSCKMFEAVREFIETIRKFIESSFETIEWEKQRTFRSINFRHVWILRKAYFFTGRSILISGP